MEVNETQGTMEVKMMGTAPESKSKTISIVDVPGHLHFRNKVQEVIEEAKAIILVIDSKEKLEYIIWLYLSIEKSNSLMQLNYYMKF